VPWTVGSGWLPQWRSGVPGHHWRDSAFTEPGEDGRIRYKLRGKVFKDRALSGEEAEWVVLEIVHRAVAILRELNDDPTHLFGYNRGGSAGYVLLRPICERLGKFRDHVNELFSAPDSRTSPATRRRDRMPTPTMAMARKIRRAQLWRCHGISQLPSSGEPWPGISHTSPSG